MRAEINDFELLPTLSVQTVSGFPHQAFTLLLLFLSQNYLMRNLVATEYSPNQPEPIHIYQAQVGESEFGDYGQSQKGKSGIFNTLSMKI